MAPRCGRPWPRRAPRPETQTPRRPLPDALALLRHRLVVVPAPLAPRALARADPRRPVRLVRRGCPVRLLLFPIVSTLTRRRYPRPEQGPSVDHELGVPAAHAAPYGQIPFFDPHRPRFPHPGHMRQLGALFFDKLGALFPFLDRYDVLHRIEQQTCSAILSNCIAGLAVRAAAAASPAGPAPHAPFYETAKSLASHVVSVPSVEALHALICLTWAEYGAGRHDAFWMYSRMAIAMCLDLGLGCEATVQVAATPAVRHRLRLTWWSVVCTADIAASCVSPRAAPALDLDQYDTRLPDPTDDASLLFRNIAELYVLRARLARVLDAHLDTRPDASLDWDLSALQTRLESISAALPPALVFGEDNLAALRDRGAGHLFVQMHLLLHAVSALLHRPSLLPGYGLPVPTDGPRADAARCRAKCVVDVLAAAERVAPETLCDPFMDLPILVACAAFMADHATPPPSPHPSSAMLARQWSEALLGSCRDRLVRLSATWGGAATFETVLDRHAGILVDRSAAPAFGVPAGSSQQWLLLPNLLDDEASDSSRASSRELSPLLAPSTADGAEYHAFGVGGPGGAPLPHKGDDAGLGVHTRDGTFYPLDLALPGPPAAAPEEDMFAGYFDEQLLDSAEAHRLLNVQVWREDSSLQADFSPLEWCALYILRDDNT